MAVSKNTKGISWGDPARIADSRESYHCGRCGSFRGSYGKDFGISATYNAETGVIQGQPLPVIETNAFDVTETTNSISALCWNCGWAMYIVTGTPEPDIPPKAPPKKRQRARKRRKKRIRHGNNSHKRPANIHKDGRQND